MYSSVDTRHLLSFPEVELRGKMALGACSKIIILPCCSRACKVCLVNHGCHVKGARLAPLSANLPGVGPYDVSEGPGAGMLNLDNFSFGSSVHLDPLSVP